MVSMDQIAKAVGGLFLVVVLVSIMPLIGSTVDDATGDLPADSDWNSTYNTDLTTAADIWEDSASLVSLAVLMVFIALVIGAVMYFRGKN